MKNEFSNTIGVLILICTLVTAGCIDESSEDEYSNSPPDYIVLDELNDYVNNSNEFSFEMYRELINDDENVFFSPYSIMMALCMAYEGALGQTAVEIEQLLDIPEDDQTRLEMVKDLQSILNQKGTFYNLSTANAYWLTKNAQLKQGYKETMENFYLAYGDELDFAKDPVGSLDTINKWVEGETNNKIKDLLSEGDIDSFTYLVLTNAIYFKGDWKYPFNSSMTEEIDFTLSSGKKIKTDMMHMSNKSLRINYANNTEVQLLQLPYYNDEISMYVMLPKENDIGSIESKLNLEYLNNLKNDLSAKDVNIYLPKFKFEQKYKLKENLIDMGIPTAFSPSADFTGISDEAEGLSISEVIHQSSVEVNEEGTEASAATAVITGRAIGGVPIQFKADHPFLFFIQHKESRQILFMGKVENPNK